MRHEFTSSSARPATGLPRCLWRALLLRCPLCGLSPLFYPLRRTRRLRQWMMPLHGCLHCRYRYEREPGYFLPATWIVHCFAVLGLGVAIGFVVDWLWHPGPIGLVIAACTPSLIFSFLFARHGKAFYLAFDQWLDPERTAAGDATEDTVSLN